MRVLLSLLFVSSLGLLGAFVVPGWSDLVLLAGPSVLACLWLIWRAWVPPIRSAADLPAVVVDGSNVMHWKDNTPQIETLREVVALLRARGLKPGVMFDANAGYLLAGKYQHDFAMARALGLKPEDVLVVPKGSVADETILTAARDLGARVVSNDRYRDWAERFPEVTMPGHVIRGGYRDGQLWLDTPATAAQVSFKRAS